MGIKAGDLVVAVHDGGVSVRGPKDVPVKGRAYRITGVYPMCYGLGCTLEGMDPTPYRGYFLYVNDYCAPRCFDEVVPVGHYFKKIERASESFEALLWKIVSGRRTGTRFRVDMPFRVKS